MAWSQPRSRGRAQSAYVASGWLREVVRYGGLKDGCQVRGRDSLGSS